MTLFDDETVSLTTTENRVRVGLVLPEGPDGYQRQYLDVRQTGGSDAAHQNASRSEDADEWEATESTLTAHDGDFYLHIGFRRDRNDTERRTDTAEDGTVLGVDFGIENIAVTSTARSFPGGELTHHFDRFEDVRGGLQQTGTRSAHRTLKQASGRQKRHSRDVLHQMANGIIEEAVEYGCSTIVFENLTNIRETIPEAKWHHRWAFRKLIGYVEIQS